MDTQSNKSGKEIFEALQKSEARYRELVDNANSIILHWDHAGIITFFNEYAQKFFGYTEEEIIGQHVMDTIVPETESTGRDLSPLMHDICNNPKKYEYNINENVTKDGRRVWVGWNNKVFTDENGTPTGALSIGSDITKQRELENDLKQAQKMESIGHLAGGIAHDFNNMLHGIIGFAEVIKKTSKENETLKNTDKIISVSQDAAALVNQLLAFSRRGKYLVKQCNIHDTIDDVIEILERTINKKITIKKQLEADKIIVTGEPTQLKSAFINIGINARDAMPDGGTLTFSTKLIKQSEITHLHESDKTHLDAEYVKISIKDTGVGIHKNNIPYIFDPYFTTKGVGKGTGMGLAAVYGTVKNHFGFITCDSHQDKGTHFDIYFPLSQVDPLHQDNSVTTEKVNNKYSIMLVDDEAIVRTYTKKLFELNAHTITTFADPLDALSNYKNNWKKYDIVVLDMAMPEMTGKELFHKLKAINPDIKAVLATGYSMEGEAQDVLKDGILDYLQKPFTLEQFENRIAPLL